MKTTLKSFALLLFFTFSSSCSNTADECLVCNEDPINLSRKVIQFNAEMSSTTVSTKGTNWKLVEIYYNNFLIDLSGIDPQSKKFKIENPNFTFERKSSKDIYIEMSANYTGKKKKLIAILQDGEYFGQITVSQSVD